jgi:flagellar motor protein MotB
VKVEQAGAKAPVVDPKDTKHRDRNARVEIVFVSSGT